MKIHHQVMDGGVEWEWMPCSRAQTELMKSENVAIEPCFGGEPEWPIPFHPKAPNTIFRRLLSTHMQRHRNRCKLLKCPSAAVNCRIMESTCN